MNLLQVRFTLAAVIGIIVGASALVGRCCQKNETMANLTNAIEKATHVVTQSAETTAHIASFLPGSFK
jgi:energy-converting hydrogenase Eha subunit G